MQEHERNTGIDLLKCISMAMVIVLHALSHGGLLDNAVGVRYAFLSLPEAAVYCAVNVFAMTSGYLLAEKSFKLSRILKLWLQVMFYSLAGLLLAIAFSAEQVTLKSVIKSLIPTLFGHYWYFTAYFAVAVFLPVLNRILHNENSLITVFCCLVVFSVLPTLVMQDPFKTGYGFSALWLAVCYLIGGYIRLHPNLIRISAKKALLFYGMTALGLWCAKVLIRMFALRIGFGTGLAYYLLQYSSPFVVAEACFLFVAFTKIRLHCRFTAKACLWLSECSFAAYLIHENLFFRQLFVSNKLIMLNALSIPAELAVILIGAACSFAAFASVDHIRLALFRICRIDALGVKADKAWSVLTEWMSRLEKGER